MSELKRKLADQYIAQARTQANTTSKVIIVWIVSLFFIWYFGIEPMYHNFADLKQYNQQKALVDLQIKSRIDQLRDDYKINQGLNDETISNKVSYDSNVKSSLSQLRTTNEKRSALIKGAQEKIAFKLPPGIEAPITPQYAPVLWSVLLLGLLLYLAWSRSIILNLCSKAIRIYRSDSNVTDNDCIDLAYNMPVWLAPLPRKGNHISPEQLRDCLGWTFSYRNAILAVSAMFTILALIQLRIVYLSSSVANFLPRHLQSDFLQVISLLLLSFLAIYFVLWFNPQKVPDYYANERISRSWSRRDIVKFFSLCLAFGLFHHTYKFSHRALHENNPRYKRKIPKFSTNLIPGFYINERTDPRPSKIIHYVTTNKHISSIVCLNSANLSPVERKTIYSVKHDTKKLPRIHLPTAVYSLEREALQEISKGNHSDAIRLLQAAVQHDLLLKTNIGKPLSHRTYDLLAGLSYRFEKDQKTISELTKMLEDRDTDKESEARIEKWNDSNSAWSKRWKNTEAKIKWSGLLM